MQIVRLALQAVQLISLEGACSKLFLSKKIFPGKDENYNSHHHIYDHLYDYNHLIQQLNDCIAFFKRDFTWTTIT